MTNKPLDILVLLRETCDPRPPVRLTPDGYGVRERGLRRITNPADLSAVEQALQLAEKRNGRVTALAVGDGRLDDHLRLALAMGCDRALRVSAVPPAGADASAWARLYQRIFEILQPELVLTGNRLPDRGADPAPALAAARLGFPCVTASLELHSRDDSVEVLRKSDRGGRQRVATSTPCLLLFEEESCEPRYPDQEGLMRSVEADIETWGEAELGLSPGSFGAAASRLRKERCSHPRPNPRRLATPDASLPAFERILALLSGGLKAREGKVHEGSVDQAVEKLLALFRAENLLGGGEA